MSTKARIDFCVVRQSALATCCRDIGRQNPRILSILRKHSCALRHLKYTEEVPCRRRLVNQISFCRWCWAETASTDWKRSLVGVLFDVNVVSWTWYTLMISPNKVLKSAPASSRLAVKVQMAKILVQENSQMTGPWFSRETEAAAPSGTSCNKKNNLKLVLKQAINVAHDFHAEIAAKWKEDVNSVFRYFPQLLVPIEILIETLIRVHGLLSDQNNTEPVLRLGFSLNAIYNRHQIMQQG